MFSEHFDYEEFSKRLWGDIYFDSESRKFKKSPRNESTNRTFVHFIMEPLYKIYAQAVGEDTEALKETLASLGIFLKPAVLFWIFSKDFFSTFTTQMTKLFLFSFLLLGFFFAWPRQEGSLRVAGAGSTGQDNAVESHSGFCYRCVFLAGWRCLCAACTHLSSQLSSNRSSRSLAWT